MLTKYALSDWAICISLTARILSTSRVAAGGLRETPADFDGILHK